MADCRKARETAATDTATRLAHLLEVAASHMCQSGFRFTRNGFITTRKPMK